MMMIIELLVKLSGPLARVLNMFLDAVERNPVANAEWQKLRERVFYKYAAPANAAKEAKQIESELEESIRASAPYRKIN